MQTSPVKSIVCGQSELFAVGDWISIVSDMNEFEMIVRCEDSFLK